MRVRRSNLGQASQVANCGANPCTWLDEIWASDECVSYMQCAQPTSVIATGSFVTSALEQTGESVGSGAASVGSAIGTAAGSTLGTATASFLSAQSPITIAVIAIAGVVLVMSLVGRR